MAGIEQVLTDGLAAGYAKKTTKEVVQRGKFQLEASEYINPEGDLYRDEWIANRTGGGQEIAKSGDERQTRLYAGGTIQLQRLAELGLTKKDVTNYLKSKINESGAATRLDHSFMPEADGDWQYSYEVIRRMLDIPLIVGMETITYKEVLVFAHGFLHTSIE